MNFKLICDVSTRALLQNIYSTFKYKIEINKTDKCSTSSHTAII